MGSWGERYVDEQVGRAWLELRLELADRFEGGLAAGHMEAVDFTTVTGESLTVGVDEDHVVILAGDSVVVSDNVDEAAYAVYEILHEDWQVIHPAFLDSPAVDVPSIEDNRLGTVVPMLGVADSKQTLQAWVETTFEESCDEPLRVRSNGDIGWRVRRGVAATVSVRDEHWIEVWSVLATEVGFKKARKVVERLARRYPGVSFSLRHDMLVMSRMVDAGPFVPQHLTDALSMHLDLAEKLAWVREAVLRKRVKQRGELEVPPALVALLATVSDLQRPDLVQAVTSRAGSRTMLEAWRAVAHREWRKARRLAAGDEDPLKVNGRCAMSWWRLRRAIDIALEAHGEAEEAA